MLTDAAGGARTISADDAAKRIFVLMPFGPDWSTSVYELIQRAVSGIDLTPPAVVNRADDITNPGVITDQIITEGFGQHTRAS